MKQADLTIGEAAQLLGITPKAIRHYQQLGLLPKPLRSEHGYRLYAPQDLRLLQSVVRLQHFGLSLKQIKTVLESDESDTVLRGVLQRRQTDIEAEVTRLQEYKHRIENYFEVGSVSELESSNPTRYSSVSVIYETLKPISNGLTDVMTTVEEPVLRQLDAFQWSSGYEIYWHRTASALTKTVLPIEFQLIGWLERYIMLSTLQPNDLQAQAWLAELERNTIRFALRQCLKFPVLDCFPAVESVRLERLMCSLLYEHGSLLQKQFLVMLLNNK